MNHWPRQSIRWNARTPLIKMVGESSEAGQKQLRDKCNGADDGYFHHNAYPENQWTGGWRCSSNAQWEAYGRPAFKGKNIYSAGDTSIWKKYILPWHDGARSFRIFMTAAVRYAVRPFWSNSGGEPSTKFPAPSNAKTDGQSVDIWFIFKTIKVAQILETANTPNLCSVIFHLCRCKQCIVLAGSTSTWCGRPQ